jgi:hypothetical protein
MQDIYIKDQQLVLPMKDFDEPCLKIIEKNKIKIQ